MTMLANRATRGVLLAVLLCGTVSFVSVSYVGVAHADESVVRAGGYGAQERAAVDFRRKRAVDAQHRARLFLRKGGRAYLNHYRKDGRVTPRRLWRRKRLGKPKVTQDLPPHLQRLEAWRARQGGAR